jgi:uncharacterized Zn-binding protein involved in type VI secretion
MSTDVYANGNAIAGKGTAGKVVAAFPDVCMSPPSPPAGPLPVPYPASSFSSDLQEGSKQVKVDGKPIALKNQSHFKSSPLGNEAATNSFGAGVVSHKITGKTFFAAWSMDVKAEGKNICRHLDITTSNHGSPPNSPPIPEAEGMATGTEVKVEEKPKCECCDGPIHAGQLGADGNPAPTATEEEWYCLDELDDIAKAMADLEAKKPPALHKSGMKKFEADMQKQWERFERFEQRKAAVEKARALGCKNMPEPPCNVYRVTPEGSAAKIEAEWDAYRPIYLAKHGHPSGTKTNHRVPKTAGGCPGNAKSEGNLAHDSELSAECLKADDELGKAQSSAADIWKARGGKKA